MTNIEVYIPRILGSVTKAEIIDTFKSMNIGHVTSLDLHFKVNENNYSYYYAFMTISLYSNILATNFKNSVIKYGMIRLLYDEEAGQYWEIKNHLDKKERINYKQQTNVPFYRYSTLRSEEICNKIPKRYELIKPYNMWENRLDFLNNRPNILL